MHGIDSANAGRPDVWQPFARLCIARPKNGPIGLDGKGPRAVGLPSRAPRWEPRCDVQATCGKAAQAGGNCKQGEGHVFFKRALTEPKLNEFLSKSAQSLGVHSFANVRQNWPGSGDTDHLGSRRRCGSQSSPEWYRALAGGRWGPRERKL